MNFSTEGIPESPTEIENIAKTNYADFKHFPVLDGLRGIAVLTVMLYHLGHLFPESYSFVKGGFLGVDIFFVLSGFLITSILLKEYEKTGGIKLKNFYYRRFFRLIPAFWLFLLCLYFGGRYLLPGGSNDVIYDHYNFFFAFSYLMNWASAANEGVTGNLNHAWSLAIEEQFYIIWSLVLFKAFGEGKTRKTIFTFTAISILILVLLKAIRAISGTPATILYYSTDTRIDALLIGCLASMVYSWRMIPEAMYQDRRFNQTAASAFLVVLLILFSFSYGDLSLYYGTLSLFALCIAFIILWLITRERSFVKRLLEFKPLCWIGQISYGLYLWHFVFYEFAKATFKSRLHQVIIALLLTFIISSLSYYVLEKPFLKLKDKYGV